jgi:hypothetical protein
VQPALDHPGEPRVVGRRAHPVGPQRHHQLVPLGERVEELRTLVRVGAQRHRLLALVDHQHPRAVHRGQRVHRVLSGGDHLDSPAGVP